MRFFKNFVLVGAVSIGIYITISIILGLIGFQGYQTHYGMIDYGSLAVFSLVLGMGSAFMSLLLSKFIVKFTMGVKTVAPDTGDAQTQKLYRMLRAASMKAGLKKVPEFGIYDSPEMNAFATGASKNSSLVAVSTGLMHGMNDDEIEGVIGHEVAHIANGDMVTMTMIQGVVNAMVIFISRIIASIVASRFENKSRHMVHFAVVLVAQMVLGFFGVLITAWFSRKREFRADEGSARYVGTRKMVAALEALQKRQMVVDPRAPQLQAFKISSQTKSGLALVLSTHPPLEQRIAELRKKMI